MPPGIEASVLLGLAGKAARVFAEPGSFLSFPLSPAIMERRRFRSIVDDPMSPEGIRAQCEFSLLVNEVPDGAVWSPSADQLLWDVYGDVLTLADLGEATRSEDQERDYQAAFATLYRTLPDGTTADSPTVVTYEQHRDAYLAAAQEYNNRKSQAELGGDGDVQEQWRRDEPALRALVDEAGQDWATAGQRAAVDDARRVLRELSASSPQQAWADYRKLFDPDLPEIFFRTTAEGLMYVPTGFAPGDVTETAWPSISVGRDELRSLADSAPEALRARLSGGTDVGAIDSVSFEYSAVTVLRPWFAPEALASRAWRFYDTQRVLCDGGVPPHGECTAWVCGMVLTRNITIRHHADAKRPVDLGFFTTAARPGQRPIVRPRPASVEMARIAARKATVAATPRLAMVHAATALRLQRQPGGLKKAATTLRALQPLVARGMRGAARSGPPAKEPVRAVPTLASVSSIRKPLLAVPAAQGPSPPATTTTDPEHLFVLAFICRPLPKAPDPDPALTW